MTSRATESNKNMFCNDFSDALKPTDYILEGSGEQKSQMHYVNQCGSKKLLLLCQMWACVCARTMATTVQYSRDGDLI